MHMDAHHLCVNILEIVEDLFWLKMMNLMIVFEKLIFIFQSEVMVMLACLFDFLIEIPRKYFDVLIPNNLSLYKINDIIRQ